jgi:hypothetical protein
MAKWVLQVRHTAPSGGEQKTVVEIRIRPSWGEDKRTAQTDAAHEPHIHNFSMTEAGSSEINNLLRWSN